MNALSSLQFYEEEKKSAMRESRRGLGIMRRWMHTSKDKWKPSFPASSGGNSRHKVFGSQGGSTSLLSRLPNWRPKSQDRQGRGRGGAPFFSLPEIGVQPLRQICCVSGRKTLSFSGSQFPGQYNTAQETSQLSSSLNTESSQIHPCLHSSRNQVQP